MRWEIGEFAVRHGLVDGLSNDPISVNVTQDHWVHLDWRLGRGELRQNGVHDVQLAGLPERSLNAAQSQDVLCR